LAKAGGPNGIAAMVAAHERYAGGSTQVLYADDTLYIMQRKGAGSQTGLVYVLNNRGDSWSGVQVQTQWPNTQFEPVAYGGNDLSQPDARTTSADGHADFWASPRGWAVYGPKP
jgi:alpha-amylase